jgi:DNA adenine methylase
MEEKVTHVRALLKWAGSKQRLLPELTARLPSDYLTRRHVEPFCGSAALFFALEPARAVLSDSNHHLVETLKSVRNELDDVLHALREFESDHSEDLYYETRAYLNSGTLHGALHAAAVLYTNRTCFNGLWRENAKGEFNVPIGSYKDPKIVDEASLRSASRVLQNASLTAARFEEMLFLCGEGDFVYLDPPYEPISKTSNFAAYTKSGFTRQDHERLAQEFKHLHELGAKVMLSNSDTPFTRALYAAWHVESVSVQRSICASTRNRAQEIIVRNYTDTKELS